MRIIACWVISLFIQLLLLPLSLELSYTGKNVWTSYTCLWVHVVRAEIFSDKGEGRGERMRRREVEGSGEGGDEGEGRARES